MNFATTSLGTRHPKLQGPLALKAGLVAFVALMLLLPIHLRLLGMNNA
jgi:hypothetical protein